MCARLFAHKGTEGVRFNNVAVYEKKKEKKKIAITVHLSMWERNMVDSPLIFSARSASTRSPESALVLLVIVFVVILLRFVSPFCRFSAFCTQDAHNKSAQEFDFYQMFMRPCAARAHTHTHVHGYLTTIGRHALKILSGETTPETELEMKYELLIELWIKWMKSEIRVQRLKSQWVHPMLANAWQTASKWVFNFMDFMGVRDSFGFQWQAAAVEWAAAGSECSQCEDDGRRAFSQICRAQRTPLGNGQRKDLFAINIHHKYSLCSSILIFVLNRSGFAFGRLRGVQPIQNWKSPNDGLIGR